MAVTAMKNLQESVCFINKMHALALAALNHMSQGSPTPMMANISHPSADWLLLLELMGLKVGPVVAQQFPYLSLTLALGEIALALV